MFDFLGLKLWLNNGWKYTLFHEIEADTSIDLIENPESTIGNSQNVVKVKNHNHLPSHVPQLEVLLYAIVLSLSLDFIFHLLFFLFYLFPLFYFI